MSIKEQLGKLIDMFEVEEEYPQYVLNITQSQLDMLISMASRYKEEK